jgi:homoserine dehydrogenase
MIEKNFKVAIAGIGTVGCGVISILQNNAQHIQQQTGRKIEIVAISSRTKNRERNVDISVYQWIDNPVELANSDADLIVETIGGEDGIAYELCKKALENKKHVVTANKALLAKHGNMLAKLAEDNNVSLNFEASIAGGIPIVKALREGMAANKINRIYGILNGTCNYILTKMSDLGANYFDVLKEAQQLGYAEAEPTLDVGGFDAAHKLTLLAALAFNTPIDFSKTYVEGIQKITSDDIKNAKLFGFCIKLIGIAQCKNSIISQRVTPCMIPLSEPIAAIGGVMNTVIVEGDYVGRIILTGPGAGQNATASAVVADIADIARGIFIPFFGKQANDMATLSYASIEDRVGRYYISLEVEDKAGVLAQIATILSKQGISIESVMQKAHEEKPDSARLIIITHETLEKSLLKALDEINHSNVNKIEPHFVRILTVKK